MNGKCAFNFVRLTSVLVVLLLVGPAITATADEFTGTLYIYTDDDGKITDMELEVTSFYETQYYPIILDEKTKAALGKFDNREVQLTGKLREMDDQMWIAVAACQLIVVGTMEADRDEGGNSRAMRLRCAKSGECYDVNPDKTSQKLAAEFDGKKVRAVGRIENNGQKEIFFIEGYYEFIDTEGWFEIDEDSDGNIASIAFAFNEERDGDEVTRTLEIRLDDTGRNLARSFAYEDVKITGFVMKEGRKEYLVVLECAGTESEEEEKEEEDFEDYDE